MKRHLLSGPRSPDVDALIKRPAILTGGTVSTVRQILEEVRLNGDAAVRAYTAIYDGVRLENLEVSREEFEHAPRRLSGALKDAIGRAARTIRLFHEAQIPRTIALETLPGVVCRREWRPIPRVGLYAPGGTAPLISTILMLGIPAQIAGCGSVILCSPPNASGEIAPAMLYAAKEAGIDRVFKCGGSQAIAAMSMGTDSIPRVDKIFGPGSRFVAAAKSLVAGHPFNVAIDLIAGPTELLVIADETANPRWVAADLLSQAEHGEDSQVVLVTTHPPTADAVEKECWMQLQSLPRRQIIKRVIDNSIIVIARNLSEAMEFSDRYAPEHLCLAVRRAESFVPMIRNAGSVFVGSMSTAVFGDYASGPNHTLPTGGTAVFSGGVTVESFMKPMFVQAISPEGASALSPTVKILAHAEGLEAHVRAVEVREGGS